MICIRPLLIILILLSFNPLESWAQAQPQGLGFSFFVGPMLPKNVPGNGEILNAVGGRISYERAQGRFVELGFAASNSEESDHRILDLSLRADFPIQDVNGFFLIGPHVSTYQKTYYGGVHVAAGLLTNLFENVFFRTEMRLNLHPGTVLLFNFGFDIYF